METKYYAISEVCSRIYRLPEVPECRLSGIVNSIRVLSLEDTRHFLDTKHLMYVNTKDHIPASNQIQRTSVIVPPVGQAVLIDPDDGECVFVPFKCLVLEVDTAKVNPLYLCALLNSGSMHSDYIHAPINMQLNIPTVGFIKEYIISDDSEDQALIADKYMQLLQQEYDLHIMKCELDENLFQLL